jgi:hypothetical protein
MLVLLSPQCENRCQLSPEAVQSLSAPSGLAKDKATASGSVASGFERTIISTVADHLRRWRFSDLQAT